MEDLFHLSQIYQTLQRVSTLALHLSSRCFALLLSRVLLHLSYVCLHRERILELWPCSFDFETFHSVCIIRLIWCPKERPQKGLSYRCPGPSWLIRNVSQSPSLLIFCFGGYCDLYCVYHRYDICYDLYHISLCIGVYQWFIFSLLKYGANPISLECVPKGTTISALSYLLHIQS